MPPPNDRTRPHEVETGSESSLVGSSQSISRQPFQFRVTPETAEQFARRVLLDCLQQSSANWWEHRAVTFDRVGSVTADETADRCRTHAAILRELGIPDATEHLGEALAAMGWETAA